ncbi:hypothetical protein F383_11320 [Gossypium arboreum]
MFLYS